MNTIFKRLLSIALSAALILPAGITPKAAETDAEKKIQILATSDQHGKFLAYDYAINEESTSGSMAQLSTLIRQRRDDNTLLIDLGDSIESNSANLFLDDEIHPMIAGLNMIGYDFWLAGNHEFNYGVDTLLKVAGKFQGTFLCGNVYDKNNKTIGDAYQVVEKDGVKIAVIGFVTPNILRWDGEKLTEYKVTNPLKDGEMQTLVERAEKEADVIVAALHMDLHSEYDVEGSGAYDYADAFPQIDVILASHGHEMHNEKRNGVQIIENINQGQTLADVDISVKPNGNGGYDVTDVSAEMISVKDTESDPQIVEALASYDQRAKEDAQTIIGRLTGGDLVPETEIPDIPQALIQESAMINLINKVQMHYTGADISAASVLNSSVSVKEGDIRKCDTALIYKYNNTLYRLQLNGKQLRQYMEWTAEYYNTYKNGDLTISFLEGRRSYLYDMFAGISYKIDISKEPGSRITDLKKADGTPVEDTDTFVLAINNYNANTVLLTYGNAFKEGDELPQLLERDVNAGESLRDMIGRYIVEEAKGALTPELSNNWEIIGNDWNEGLHAQVARLVKEGKIEIGSSDGRSTANTKAITVDDLKKYVSVAKVNLNANGGTVSNPVYYAQEGEAYGSLPTPERTGYQFDGWYTAKTGGSKVTASTKAASGTLYARWESKATGKSKITSLKAGKKRFTVTYAAISGADGYRIDYSTNKNLKNAKSVNTKSTSATVKNLQSKKSYYVRVRAYQKGSDGKRSYGSASVIKKITVK